MAQASALKDLFDADRFRQIANQIKSLDGKFDGRRFLALALVDLESLSLMERLRRMSQSLHATLPSDYQKCLTLLRQLAPRIEPGLVSLVLPDFVGLYGLEHFEASMDALKFFTRFGSSEFAVRQFLRRDLARTLSVMEKWSHDEDETVRRLASEGCRPRLPWSFRLEALVADPEPVSAILESLKADPSLFVRKSVANHLNDITKDHPEWVFKRIQRWPVDNPRTAWIVKRALRTLIKKGDRRALGVIGAGARAEVLVEEVCIEPRRIRLGERVSLSFRLQSRSSQEQRLVVDYIVHYVKKSGATAPKVFKLKELRLGSGESVRLTRAQSIRDFTTRIHYPGRHEVDIVVNGEKLGRDFFELSR